LGKGVIIDDRTIAGKRIGKVALMEYTDKWNCIASNEEKLSITFDDNSNEIEHPISVVDFGSSIDILKFYVHPDINLEKGEVVWTYTGDRRKIYYQITNASIIDESQDNGNTIKRVLVTASQLGLYQKPSLQFEIFPWVAVSGQLIYRENEQKSNEEKIPEGRIQIGIIPKTEFPVHLSIDDLVTHNAAIIGVTGSGKTYLSLAIIEQLISSNIRVLIIDLTREYEIYLRGKNPIKISTTDELMSWYDSKEILGIYDFKKSTNYPLATKEVVKKIFEKLSIATLQAGKNIPARFCFVFEEAHSIIPEWNQVADKNDVNYVNETARIILQGRKYGMGNLIITQRTANVTKTILNQCNTVFALRSFDQTGLDFLKNYMGEGYAHAISTLSNRQCILVGKASLGNMPIIFNINDLTDHWKDDASEKQVVALEIPK
jgi:uncharacterized protein